MKCIEPEALLKEYCWLPYLGKKCKLCIQELEHVLYVVDMLPRFYKILSGEKEKKFYRSFQQAKRLRFTGISSR